MKFRWFIISLLLLGALRLGMFLSHTPQLGYANNYDMNRLQACLHIWPLDSRYVGVKSEQAPLTNYHVDYSISFDCVPASNLVIDAPTSWMIAHISPDHFSLRAFGIARALLLTIIVAGFVLHYWRRKDIAAALVNALGFAIVLCDPANSLYLNTFYAEYASLIYWVLALNCLYVFARENNRCWFAALCASLLLLGTSKMQHALLPLMLIAPLLWFNRTQISRRQLGTLILLALLCPILDTVTDNHESRVMQQANVNHAIATALFSSKDPGALQHHFGLESCTLPDKATTPYRLYHKQLLANCEQVKTLTHRDLARALLQQPSLLLAMTQEALARSRPWISTTMGHVENGQMTFCTDACSSLDTLSSALPAASWWLSLLLPAALLVLVSVRWPSHVAQATALTALALANLENFFTAILGDGLFNLQKHLHLWHNTLWLIVLILLVALCVSVPRHTTSASVSR